MATAWYPLSSGSFGDEATPELPYRLKYRLTLSKLEALVRHLEKNEKDLKQLEGASIARSEHWLVTLKSTLRIFQDEWSREMARRHMTVSHQHQDGQFTERIGDVRFHDLQQTAVKLNNWVVGLLDEIGAGPPLDQGNECVDKVTGLIRAIEERQEQAKAARDESPEIAPGQLLVDPERQDELQQLCEPILAALDEFAQGIEASLEAGEVLEFRSS